MGRTTVSRIAPMAQVKRRKRAAAYARVSMGKDAMLHSLAAQVSYYSELIQRNPEWEYAGVYADSGLTGTRENRLEFQRMLADCRAGKIDVILVKSISRLARNTVTLLETVRELKSLGIGVIFEEQNMNTLSGDGELMLSILASIFQEESRSVSENCKWRIRKKFEQGIPTGLRMYGYDVVKGVFTVVPGEAEVVRRIFHMYLEGMGRIRIMKTLNRAGIPAPEGGKWNHSVIDMILRNEKYAGDLLLQKYYTNNHVEKKTMANNGELPQYFVAADHQPIIDRATFDAAQAEIARRAQIYGAKDGEEIAEEAEDTLPEEHYSTGKSPDYLEQFGDRLFCGICGKRYRRKITHKGTEHEAAVWICRTFHMYGKAYCASQQIPEKTLLELTRVVLNNDHSADDIDRIEMHPGKRVLFVFRDGHTDERFWQAASRKDSWDADKRKKAAEKTAARHRERRNVQ